HFHSPFTQATSGPYKPDLTLLSILKTGLTYAKLTPGTQAAALLAASTLLWYGLGSTRIHWLRLGVFLALSAAIPLPYLCLPNHIAPYYALNWTIWQTGGGLLLLWTAWPGIRSAVAIVVVAAICVFVTQPGRQGISSWYSA